MKRKIFSKLLMVALVIAAVGSFVSCKDYDDDINNLQKQIDTKAALSELTALQSTLDSKIAAAQSAAQAAQATADAAATKTAVADLKTALEAAIADAKKAGTDAGTQAGNAITAANKAQETAEAAAQAAKDAQAAAKKALDEELAKIAETYATKAEAAAASTAAADAATAAAEANAAIEKLGDTYFTITEAEKLQKQVDDLKADLESNIEEKVKEAIKDVENAKASVDAIWSAVTSVEFFVAEDVIENSDVLNFQFGKQLDNVFGNGKELHSYEATNDPQTYSSKNDIKAENIYFIRASPVNAEVDAANLKLMNSLGEDLSEFVNIKAEAYNELLTRSAETGIWKVTVTLKDDVDIEKLQKATSAVLSRDKKRTISAAVYAIAIGNTEDADATRFAVTSYDLKALTNEYTAGTELDFTVNGKGVSTIHNRWNGAYILAEDESMEKDSTYFELAWQTAINAKKGGYTVPAVKAITNIGFDADGNALNNYVYDADDARQGLAPLQVQPEEQIVIKFDSEYYPQIDRYYVQFEKDNAIESAPSEYESWLSYNVTGLSTMKKASERLILTVPSDASEGDVIGFRVYAVNYDGTLVDPDGKAFYIQVGSISTSSDADQISGTFTARQAAFTANAAAIMGNKANSVIVPYDILKNFKLAKGTTLTSAGFAASVLADADNKENVPTLAANTRVDIIYLTSNDADDYEEATNVEDVKYIALNVRNPENVVDDATIVTDPLKIVDPDKHDKILGYISFVLTKGEIEQITTNANDNKITWKTGQNGTFYPNYDQATWNALFDAAATNPAEIDLEDYANNLNAYDDLTKYAWALTVTDYTTAQGTAWTNAGFTMTNAKATLNSANCNSNADNTADDWKIKVPTGMVQAAKTATLAIKSVAAIDQSLSRTAKAGVKKVTDASTETVVEAAKTHTYQSLTLTFKDVVDTQVYDWSIKYDYAAVGADVAALEEKDATLYAKYSAATIYLGSAWKSAADGDGSGKIEAAEVAVKNYPALAAGVELEEIYATSKNSAVESFWSTAQPFAKNHYVKYATEKWKSTDATAQVAVYVLSDNGTKNEYLTPTMFYKNPAVLTDNAFPATDFAGTDIQFTKTSAATPLLTTINQKLVIKVYDAFGRVQTLEIPFELVP